MAPPPIAALQARSECVTSCWAMHGMSIVYSVCLGHMWSSCFACDLPQVLAGTRAVSLLMLTSKFHQLTMQCSHALFHSCWEACAPMCLVVFRSCLVAPVLCHVPAPCSACLPAPDTAFPPAPGNNNNSFPLCRDAITQRFLGRSS